MDRENIYMIPTAPNEVTINEAFKWLLDVEPLKPKELLTLAGLKDDKEKLSFIEGFTSDFLGNQLRPFLEANLCFFSQLPKQVAKTFNIHELLDSYNDTQKALFSPPKYQYKEVLKVKGVLYALPSENMRESILFQYAEADQAEANLNKSGQNMLYLLPVLMALLLRKEGEPLFFKHEQVQKRIELFKGANLLEGWQVFSYFQATKQAVKTKFGKTLFSPPTMEERKAGVKGLQDSFGWLLTIKRLAEKKIFDLSGLNSQDSVLNTNTWECLTHLSLDNAIGAYQQKLYKQ